MLMQNTSIQSYPEQMREFEAQCSVLLDPSKQTERPHTEQVLLQLQTPGCIEKLKYFFVHTESQHAKYIAVTCLRDAFSRNWQEIENLNKKSVLEFALTYLSQNGPKLERHTLKMLIQLIAKVAKQSWLEVPEKKQGVIVKLLQMCYQSDFHFEAGLKTLVDIIVEMGYLPKT